MSGTIQGAVPRRQGLSGHTLKHNGVKTEGCVWRPYGRLRAGRAAAARSSRSPSPAAGGRAAARAPQFGAGEKFGQFRVVSGRQHGQPVERAGDGLPLQLRVLALAGPAADLQPGRLETVRKADAGLLLAADMVEKPTSATAPNLVSMTPAAWIVSVRPWRDRASRSPRRPGRTRSARCPDGRARSATAALRPAPPTSAGCPCGRLPGAGGFHNSLTGLQNRRPARRMPAAGERPAPRRPGCAAERTLRPRRSQHPRTDRRRSAPARRRRTHMPIAARTPRGTPRRS